MSTMNAPDDPCPLCGRPMEDGRSINKHHTVPKSLGGREVYWIHIVCHSKIHAVFTERELLHTWNTFEALRSHPEIEKFVRWVARKPATFRTRHVRSKERRRAG